MLGPVDHVGYLAADLQGAVADFSERFGLEVSRWFEREQYSLKGAYLGPGEGHVELFTFTDPQLLATRLPDGGVVLDHVAYLVEDIDAEAVSLKAAGVRLCGPDIRTTLDGPVDLGGIRHLWTAPETCLGLCVQLMQR